MDTQPTVVDAHSDPDKLDIPHFNEFSGWTKLPGGVYLDLLRIVAVMPVTDSLCSGPMPTPDIHVYLAGLVAPIRLSGRPHGAGTVLIQHLDHLGDFVDLSDGAFQTGLVPSGAAGLIGE